MAVALCRIRIIPDMDHAGHYEPSLAPEVGSISHSKASLLGHEFPLTPLTILQG
jgi:hypothetical protein